MPSLVVEAATSRPVKTRKPTASALEHARDVRRRVQNRSAQVRRGFVQRNGVGDEPPPLARMVRGGRGGLVRVRLYLSMLWFAGREPYDVEYPASAWAGLLGLADPRKNGARRVTDAIQWLEREQFVRVERKRGHHSHVWLLSDLGSGEDYVPPGDVLTRNNQDADRSRHFYFKLPADLWSNGWLSILSGPALSMLLVLWLEASIKQEDVELWFSPLQASERFDLSEDTRGRGFAELEAYRIIDRNRRPVKPDTFGDPRFRNTYDLHSKRLSTVFEGSSVDGG